MRSWRFFLPFTHRFNFTPESLIFRSRHNFILRGFCLRVNLVHKVHNSRRCKQEYSRHKHSKFHQQTFMFLHDSITFTLAVKLIVYLNQNIAGFLDFSSLFGIVPAFREFGFVVFLYCVDVKFFVKRYTQIFTCFFRCHIHAPLSRYFLTASISSSILLPLEALSHLYSLCGLT